MKTNLIEKVKRMSTEYRFGDFFRNFIAVVLGIVITFAGSDLIEERKIRNEVKDALSLVKDEILLNRETIEELMEQQLFEQRGPRYLRGHHELPHRGFSGGGGRHHAGQRRLDGHLHLPGLPL